MATTITGANPQIEQLLSDLLSADNLSRQRAEAIFNEAKRDADNLIMVKFFLWFFTD